jgi:aryl-phospho-beta-D-glucosidase BglC (GH1 family)
MRDALTLALALVWFGLQAFEPARAQAGPVAPGAQVFLAAADFARLRFRGYNLDVRPTPELADDDFAALAAQGVNLVRIMLPVIRCPDCRDYSIPAADLAYLDRVLDASRAHRFRVVIALAPLPTGPRAEFWSDAGLRRSLAARWQEVAGRYRNEPRIAGLDLVNEPVVPGADDRRAAVIWAELAEDLIRAIRIADTNHAIVVQPAPWGLAKGFRHQRPVSDPNVVYSFHLYDPHEITHQGLPRYAAAIPYPSDEGSPIGRWDRARLARAIDPVIEFGRRTGAPVLVGEFSCIRWAPQGSAVRYVRDAIELFEAQGWSWLYHAYRTYDGWDAEMDERAPRSLRPDQRAGHRRSDAPMRVLLEPYFRRNK